MNAEEAFKVFQRHLRALLRAELLIAEIKLGAMLKKTALMIVAGLIAVFGLATLNVAAYHALEPIWGDVWALLAVAAGDFVIAGILILAASRPASTPELRLATELRDQSVEAIELDARLAIGEVTSFVRWPLKTATSILSIIAELLRNRRKKRED